MHPPQPIQCNAHVHTHTPSGKEFHQQTARLTVPYDTNNGCKMRWSDGISLSLRARLIFGSIQNVALLPSTEPVQSN